MTAQKKQYSNNDLMKELSATRAEVKDVSGRLAALETWKISQDAGKAAVDEYRRQESSDKQAQGKENAYSLLKDAGPYILIILAGVAVVLYTYASRVK